MEPNAPSTSAHAPRKRKNHRGGKKKKQTRRKSFAGLAPDDVESGLDRPEDMGTGREGFYSRPGRNASNTSLDSDALLDHRCADPFSCTTHCAVDITNIAQI